MASSRRPDRYNYADRGDRGGHGKTTIDTTDVPLATEAAAEEEQSIVGLSDQEVLAAAAPPFSHQAIRTVSTTRTIIDDRTKFEKAVAASENWHNSNGIIEGPFFNYIKTEGKNRERGWLRNLSGISSTSGKHNKVMKYYDLYLKCYPGKRTKGDIFYQAFDMNNESIRYARKKQKETSSKVAVHPATITNGTPMPQPPEFRSQPQQQQKSQPQPQQLDPIW